MPDQILVLYGSYRSDRMGIRLANFVVSNLRSRGADAELIDAKAVSLPCSIACTKNSRRRRLHPPWELLRPRSKRLTLSCS